MHPTLKAMLDGSPRPVYLVLGPEPLLVDRAVLALRQMLEPHAQPSSFNVTLVRASEPELANALSAARTLPMMASRRVVVVRELELASEAWLASLLVYLERPPEETSLVLAGRSLPKVQKGGRNWPLLLPKAVAAAGAVLKFGEEDADPMGAARAAARALGRELAPAEARLLVELTGRDLGLLEREVEKLDLLVDPGQPIEASDIHAVCSLVAEPVVWDLTSGIAARRVDQALGALHRLVDDGEAPHKLLALIVWQMRIVLRMADMVRQGRPDDEIRQALRLRSDVFGPLRREIDGAFPGAAVLLGQLARAHQAMNSIRAGDQRVLEALVLELCGR